MTTIKLPEPFIARLTQIIPAQQLKAVINTFNTPKIFSFRVNTLAASIDSIITQLHQLNLSPQAVPWYNSAFTLPTSQRDILTHCTLLNEGKLYIQSLPSMYAALVLDPQSGEKILDLAAAPGSKTSQIACLMHNQGHIAAVEKVKSRFHKLKANLQQQHVNCAQLFLKDGAVVWRYCQNTFDRVLLDAPCSSETRFNLADPQTFNYWSEKKIKDMSRKQAQLIYSAFHCVKPGGVLVYSTCSFSPEENEAIIAKLFKKFPHQFTIEEINVPFDNIQAGLTQWRKQHYPDSIKKCLRILPNEKMSGFFITKINKR